MSKKENKKLVNEGGAFLQIPIEVVEVNSLGELAKQVPADAFVFKGIASTGELNDNDYIIRESAWKKALPDYMANPIILFQHNDDRGIGNTLSAKVTSKGLEVIGYIYRDLDKLHTGGAIERGVYRAISTGHITKDFEFENIKTGEVISKDEYKKLGEENGWFGEWSLDWKRAVTALRYAEWSVVAVGSNKAALRTNNTEREFLSRYFEINEEPGITPAETPEAEPVVEVPVETPVEVPSETPVEVPAEAPEEVLPEPVEEPVDVEGIVKEAIAVEHDVMTNQLTESIKEVESNTAPLKETLGLIDQKITVIAEAMVKLDKQFIALKKVVDSIPDRKGLVAITQYPKVEKKPVTNGIQELFGKAGVKLK